MDTSNNGGMWGELGRDFWLFRMGQAISAIGDMCNNIALSWWILEKTGSPAKLASIISPALLVSVFLLPLFGPFGDKFSRKKLVLIGDAWRGFICAALAAMVYFDYFSIPLVAVLYIMLAVGSALFNVAAGSIVPQLVRREVLGKALQQSQAIMSLGAVLGGAAGGVMVSVAGVAGAFVADGLSYFVAVTATLMIRADTCPPPLDGAGRSSPLVAWAREIKDGFAVVYRIPVIFWLAFLAAFINFAYAPTTIALPVMVKTARGLPPWFLGALESSVSAGAIIGALMTGWLCRKLYQDVVIVLGVTMVGLGLALLPFVPNLFLPLFVMFSMGIGVTCANIAVLTQISLGLPDNFRARVNSIMSFMTQSAMPLGTMTGGLLLSGIGLNMTMLISGGVIAVVAPMLYLIGDYARFYRLPPDEAQPFIARHYPDAFK